LEVDGVTEDTTRPQDGQGFGEAAKDWLTSLEAEKYATEAERRAFLDGRNLLRADLAHQREEATKEEIEEDERIRTQRAGKPPAFPLGVFPKDLQDYVRQAASAIMCPIDYIAVSALAVLGSALGPRRVLKIKEVWKENGLLWVGLVGRPGDAKSPAIAEAMWPIRIEDANLYHAWRAAQDEYEECQKNGDDDCPDPPEHEHCTVSDITIEQLAQVLQATPRGVLQYRDELAGWIHSMNIYRGGRGSDVEQYKEIWSGLPLKVDRKTTADAYVEHPFVAVLGGIQPERLDVLAKGGEDGFPDRLLLPFPSSLTRTWSEVDVDPHLRQRVYVSRYLALRQLDPVAETEFTPAARKTFTTWYEEWERYLETLDGFVAGSSRKLEQYCARFALILAHVRSVDPRHNAPNGDPRGRLAPVVQVDVQDVEGGIALVGYFSLMMRRVDRYMARPRDVGRSVGDQEKAAREVVRWMRARGRTTVTARELTKSRVGQLARAKHVHEVIELLEEQGRITVERKPLPGDQVSIIVTLKASEDDDDV
jgi:Protein of unknown function (DUF3987)